MKIIINENQYIRLKNNILESIGESETESAQRFLNFVERRLRIIFGKNPTKIRNKIENLKRIIEMHNLDDAIYLFNDFIEKNDLKVVKKENDVELKMPEKLQGINKVIDKPVEWFVKMQQEFEKEMERRKRYDQKQSSFRDALNENKDEKFKFFMTRFIRDFIG